METMVFKLPASLKTYGINSGTRLRVVILDTKIWFLRCDIDKIVTVYSSLAYRMNFVSLEDKVKMDVYGCERWLVNMKGLSEMMNRASVKFKRRAKELMSWIISDVVPAVTERIKEKQKHQEQQENLFTDVPPVNDSPQIVELIKRIEVLENKMKRLQGALA